MRLLLVCQGGALGSGARYLVALGLAPAAGAAGPSFPWPTFAVNVAGCFLLELLVGLAAAGLRLSVETRLLLGTGIRGGFTTYSSFNTETAALWRAGAPRLAIAYLLATVLTCVVAGLLGAQLGRVMVAPAAAP